MSRYGVSTATAVLAGLALLVNCGGERAASSGGTGGSSSVSASGWTSSGGATSGMAGGSTSDRTSDGGVVVDGEWSECTLLGGSCLAVEEANGVCPEGTYNPFGDGIYCPNAARARCCVRAGGLGSPCDESHPCDDPKACWRNPGSEPSQAFCTRICDFDGEECPAGAMCVSVMWSSAPGVCLMQCTSDHMCREGWSCQPHQLSAAPTKEYAAVTVCVGADGTWGQLLGGACKRDLDCLSRMCWWPPVVDPGFCSVTCDDDNPCLPGYACESEADCTTAGCGHCVPGQGT